MQMRLQNLKKKFIQLEFQKENVKKEKKNEEC